MVKRRWISSPRIHWRSLSPTWIACWPSCLPPTNPSRSSWPFPRQKRIGIWSGSYPVVFFFNGLITPLAPGLLNWGVPWQYFFVHIIVSLAELPQNISGLIHPGVICLGCIQDRVWRADDLVDLIKKLCIYIYIVLGRLRSWFTYIYIYIIYIVPYSYYDCNIHTEVYIYNILILLWLLLLLLYWTIYGP